MKEATPSYTTIQHAPRIRYGLTNNDYCIASIIYHMSNNPKAYIKGWCTAGKETLGKYFGISRQSVHIIITKLEEKGLIQRQEQTGFIRTTATWYEQFECFTPCKESLHPVNKPDLECKESLQEGVKKVDTECKESLHYNNKIIIEDNNSNKDTTYKAPQVSDFLFPDLNIEPTEKKEKENPTPVAGGPSKKKKKVEPIPWSKSIFADLNYFIRFFEGTPYEQAKADFRHYHWAIRNWAVNAETGEDIQFKANWAATISNWIKKDYKDSRLVTTHDQVKASEKTGSQFERRASQAERVAEKLKLMREGDTT